jgi:hypothetical protein
MARRVRVSDFLPEPIELEMPDGRTFSIDALGVNEMMALFRSESMLAEAGKKREDGEAAPSAYEGLRVSNEAINDLLRKRFPDQADSIDYDLPPAAIGGLFAALAGGEEETVADEVRKAVEEAASGSQTGEGSESPDPASEDGSGAEDAPDGAASAPLVSTKPSLSSSSTSEPSSTGEQAGGETSPGASSAERSATSQSEAAA